MNVGFTGTRDGLTCEQHASLVAVLKAMTITEFHHGCCVGADEEAMDAAFEVSPRPRIVGHPPTKTHLITRWINHCDELRAREPYLIRNARIVDETECLVACPKDDEELRSGTWATVRYARKLKRPITIIYADGMVELENQSEVASK